MDAESWTLLLWQAQERGLRWQQTSSHGGAAIAAACAVVQPGAVHRRDVWPVLHRVRQVQGRLDRAVQGLVDRMPTVERQAARLAAGQRLRGRNPQADVVAHAAEVAAARAVTDGLRYLGRELRSLLAVVVLRSGGVLDAATRRQEVATILGLLAAVATTAPLGTRRELQELHTHIQEAQAGLLAVADDLEAGQQRLQRVLGAAALGLLSWAWQQRRAAGWTLKEIVAGLPEGWRVGATQLLRAWAGAVQASSAATTWHSLLRPHLAVHRVLSPGLLVLLAVWHNHRVYARGAHNGQSPLQVSGVRAAAADWLTVLGYPPAAAGATAPPPRAEPIAQPT